MSSILLRPARRRIHNSAHHRGRGEGEVAVNAHHSLHTSDESRHAPMVSFYLTIYPESEPLTGSPALGMHMQTEIHSFLHINSPTTDKERTKEWYSKVFGMVQDDVSHLSNTPVLLMTTGKCDLHFTPVKE